MGNIRVESWLLLLAFILPMPIQADGGMLLKSGSTQLLDTSQEFNGARDIDQASTQTYGALIEHRFRKIGLGVGPEYIFYRHRYKPPVAPKGTAETSLILLSARKYFRYQENFRPYLGAGVGYGDISVKDSLYRDRELSIAFQIVAGTELRIGHVLLALEAKYILPGNLGGRNEYYPDAIGLFAGIGFNW